MELWFYLAVAGAVAGGIPPFLVKIAAKRNYDAELFILFGAVCSVLVMVPLSLYWIGFSSLNLILVGLSLVGGLIAAWGGVLRVHALRHIDTTIYFPLVKLFSPLLVILSGVFLFQESFTAREWVGLVAGLFIPLLLISRLENERQNNLKAGLLLMLITAGISAVGATLNKYVTDLFPDSVLLILMCTAIGVLIGSVALLWFKHTSLSFLVSSIKNADRTLFWMAFTRGFLLMIAFGCALFSYAAGGPLGIVYTIGAMYILVPIVLSIIFYNEHWNWQKATAIVLSVASLALLG